MEIGENREDFSKIFENSFQLICNPYNVPLGKIPYISVFDKVTALLILWEFDRRIDGEFYNDVVGRSRDLLIILVLLKKLGK